jgi:hypothetical protein
MTLCTEQVLVYICRPLADFPQGVGGFTTADGSGFPAAIGAPQTRPRWISRGAGAEAVEEVADRHAAGGLPGFMSFAGRGRMRTAGAA